MYDLLLAASLLVWLGVGIAYLRHPVASMFHPATIYYAFHGFLFVIRPIFARFYDFQLIYRLYGFHPSLSDKITVLLAANLGFLVFMGVAVAATRRSVVFRRDSFDEEHKARMIPAFLAASALFGPFGLASILRAWSERATDSTTMVRDMSTGVAINTTSTGWFNDTQLAVAPIVVGIAWLFRFKPLALVPFGLYVVLQSGTGSRGSLIYACLALAIIYLIEKRKRWPELRSLALIGLAAVLFTTIIQDRGKSVREMFGRDDAVIWSGGEQLAPLEQMDYANLEFFEFIVYAVPQRTGTYGYFVSNLQLFTEPIPRAWWPGKPIGAPIKLFNLWDYGAPIGITGSLPGSGWGELGYLGVIVQCAAFALFYGLAYRKLLLERQTSFTVFAYTLIVAATVVTFRDGSVLTVVKQLTFYLAPPGVAWLLMRIANVPTAADLRAAAASAPPQISVAPGAGTAERRRRAALSRDVPHGIDAPATLSGPARRRKRLAEIASSG
ncbi:MAG: O-antigen polymerase [Novosphingobium sp.]